MRRKWEILEFLARSPTARRILERRGAVEARLRAQRRRLWPLATVAGWFDVSPSLLRKWAGRGWIRLFERPTRHHRPGLTPQAVRRFLAGLAEVEESGMEFHPQRARPAEERCREVVRGLKPGETVAPAEFAARAGVAVTTVRRLLVMRELHAWYPTPHRPRICDWAEKERRNRLTKKTAKMDR